MSRIENSYYPVSHREISTNSPEIARTTDHPITRKEFCRELELLQPTKFVNDHIIDRLPWLFETRSSYRDWKAELAHGLDVDPHEIIVVGSAATGFSLTPGKDFSLFHDDSDIDVAIISQWYFDLAWRHIRKINKVDFFYAGSSESKNLGRHRECLVFDGAIATDRVLNFLPFGPAWTTAFSLASNRYPTVGRSINGRIYRNCDSLREYHVENVSRIRTQLLTSKFSRSDTDNDSHC
jgi:predicted nucleotidyltransferase